MENIVTCLVYLIVFVVSISLGLWFCKYTYLHSQEPERMIVIKNQIRDPRLSLRQKLGVFCSLYPYPIYPGYYSAISEDTDKRHASVGFPQCPASSYRQCVNNVYSATINPKDNEDYFKRSLLPVGANNVCQYGSTYSTCYPKTRLSELENIQEAYCRLENMKNDSGSGNRVNMYNMSCSNIERGDD